ncbi:MuDRA-like transposase [Cucumis melo var. makuwa]|uniref:MuDRA-like transposase n=1 Tax=Cucumis melo var. makuwa TaxID=1194695 RepID=A0A5D3E420_CUCMM|nr:MuDRA-like transposase [Cucumis melo var. makuwa]
MSFKDTPAIRRLSFFVPPVHFVAPPFQTIQSTLSVFSYFVRYGSAWDEGRRKYEGGVLKGIVVGENEAPLFELSNDSDLKFYILSENPLEVPLYVSFEPRSNQSKKVSNKDYNSVSGSNQVHNLNPLPPIAMDTLDENEVDIGEVQASKILGCWRINKVQIQGTGRLYKSRDIIEDMRKDYGINMSYEKAWRARENAYERVRGSLEESYNLLCRYGEALKLTNPAYAEAVYPVRNQSDWKTSEDYVHMIVLPPKVVKRVGRLKKKRIPSIGEASKLHKCGRYRCRR